MLLGYVRVSTTEQAASNRTSLSEQERVINGFAMMRGIAGFDTTIFKDPGISGATPLEQRPAGKELLDIAKPGDTVCAAKLDRMFRSAIDALKTAEELKKKGIHLVLLDMGDQPVTSNGMAECFFTMAAAFAQLERTRIAERMRDGRNAKADKGGHIGGPPPYGFSKVGKGRDAMLEPNLEEQALMEQVLAWSRYRRPAEIIRMLTRRRLFARNGKPFVEGQIVRIRKHARLLWPNPRDEGRKRSGKSKAPPVVTHSEDGQHTTIWA